MADFLRHLPAPISESPVLLDPSLGSLSVSSFSEKPVSTQLEEAPTASKIPPYGKRGKWFPRKLADFGDGGAFPEIHYLQYPLDLGRQKTTTVKTVALQQGADGKLQYDAVIRQKSDKLALYTKPADQHSVYAPAELLQKPDETTELEVINKTKVALELAVNQKLSEKELVSSSGKAEPEFFKYTPNQNAPGHNANFKQRIIRMVEKPKDPLEIAKFKHKRVPAAPPSPPPAVQHSPPRKLTLKDQQEWKIPPSVSNWKNQKGYVIPLDKRIQADGRGLHDVSINDKFASLTESLYVAERSAREEIRIRNEMLKQKKAKEEEIREMQLRELAAKARAERSNLMKQKEESTEDAAARREREQVERERKREVERDLRLQRAGKRTKVSRDADRDVSERVALGQAQPTSQEMLYDARLFNQTTGLDSGFEAGNDESYAVYDKPLFADRAAAGIYQYSRDRFQQSVGDGTALPSFAGASNTAAERTAPVEFEKDTADPFGLDNLLSEAKRR